MDRPLIMLSSVTHAMRAKQLLVKNGIVADIVRTPKTPQNRSCGYSVFVPRRTDEAEEILKRNGFKILGRADRE